MGNKREGNAIVTPKAPVSERRTPTSNPRMDISQRVLRGVATGLIVASGAALYALSWLPYV